MSNDHGPVMLEETIQGNNEFRIFHLKSFSIICRQMRFYDFELVKQEIRQFVQPMKRPVVICPFIIDKWHFPPHLLVVQLVSDQFHCQEFVAVNEQDSRQAITSAIEQLRDWVVHYPDDEFSYVSTNGNAHLHEIRLLIKSSVAYSWKDFSCVSLSLREEGSHQVEEVIHMLLRKSTVMDDIKATFVDFMKLFYMMKIRAAMNEDVNGDLIERFVSDIHWSQFTVESSSDLADANNSGPSANLLERLMMMRKRMLTFYDNNGQKILNSKHLEEERIGYDVAIIIDQKCRQSMEFIHPTSNDLSAFLYQESTIVRSVTDENPTMALVRNDWKCSGDIKTAIEASIGSTGEVLLVSDTGMIADDTAVDHVDDVMYYAVIERFNENSGHIQKGKELGCGGFGSISECVIEGSREQFVLKELDLSDSSDKYTNRGLISELLVAAKIGTHPRIMKYVRFLEDEFSFFIVMHRMELSLGSFIRTNTPLTEDRIAFFTKQILEGLDYLHDNKIVHRDIKGDNVLLDKSGNAKLTDFGLSKYISIQTSLAEAAGLDSQVGTYNWTAPDVVNETMTPYGTKCDIWSVGATMVEMITGCPPFVGLTWMTIIMLLNTDKRIDYEFPTNLSQDLKHVVDCCLEPDPETRPDCKKLLRMPYLMKVIC